MVCFRAAAGNVAATLTARGKHYVLFNEPGDMGRALKESQPEIGWVPDTDGHPTLPYSVACKLILPLMAEKDKRETGAFEEFATAQLFARLWSGVVGEMNLDADDIFREVLEASERIEDKDFCFSIAGDWQKIQGDIDDDGHCRWTSCITRGDIFRDKPGGVDNTDAGPGLAGAEMYFYTGPYMLPAFRGGDSHFVVATATMGKFLASDDDESLCDGAQLAAEVAAGMLDSRWPSLFTMVTAGNDDTTDEKARGGPRITDLRNRMAYRDACLAEDGSIGKIIARMLPTAMRRKTMVPCLSIVFCDVNNGNTILDGIADVAAALGMKCGKCIDDRVIASVERILRPLERLIPVGPASARLQWVLEKIDSTNLGVQTLSTPGSADAHDAKSPAMAKLLVTQLTKPNAIELIQELAEYRTSSNYEPTAYLEWAHSGRWPAEMRAAKLVAANALPAGSTARRDAVAAVSANDARIPVYALMQLAWGHVKTLEGYPELQDIYDLGQTLMPDVFARLCARAFSADGQSIPPALRFARTVKLAAAAKGRSWDTELDFCSDGDACMLSFLEGGDGAELERIQSALVYTDISQVLRVRRIGANVLAFFGVRDSSTQSWRQLVSSCEHSFQTIPASDPVKRKRLGKAMQRFIQRSLGDIGKRIDLVRYSAKHDAVGPRDLLPLGKGGAADEFAEAVARIQEDQRRKRSAVADDSSAMAKVRLPAEAHSLAAADVLEPVAKRQQQQQQQQQQQPQQQQQRLVSFSPTATPDGTGTTYTPITLTAKGVRGQGLVKFTIRVDTKGASRWLSEHGVKRACLAFQFGHVSQRARRWASCPSQGSAGHDEAPEGPHAIAEGWTEAAPSFVHPADKKLLSSA